MHDPVPSGSPLAFSALLREYRRQALLTQEELASRTGLSPRTIRRLESDRSLRPRPATLRILADQLGLADTDRAVMVAAASADAETAPARPGWAVVAPQTAAPVAATAGSPPGAADGQGEPAIRRPAQLPVDVFAFTGRYDELATLDRLLAAQDRGESQPATTVISVVSGPAGVGKTALAVHWAHRVVDRFPGGQLYADLRGFGPEPPTRPDGVLRGFFGALGVRSSQIPSDLDGQVGLYRSLLADRRMLIVLDNARDADQVRQLLPGSRGSTVLITSREPLTSLVATEGARPVLLGLLPAVQGRQLLISRIGAKRAGAEPDALEAIVDGCAGLPLALVIVAAHAATQPIRRLADLADNLRQANGGRLASLDGGDPKADVRTVFSWSYRRLSAPSARLFRLLGVHPGPEIEVGAAARLAGLSTGQTHLLLRELTRAALIEERSPARYAGHDLLRAYAVELSSELDNPAARHAALHRVLDYYLQVVAAADRLLDPHRDPIDLSEPQPGVDYPQFATRSAAVDWLTGQESVLVAAVDCAAAAGLDSYAWRLAWALVTYLDEYGRWHEWIATHRTAVSSAARVGDRLGQAHSYRGLARAEIRLGDDERALRDYQRALDLFGEVGDQTAQAHTRLNLGRVFISRGRYREALVQNQQVAALFEATGHRIGLGRALNNIGWIHIQLGEYATAIGYCERAIALHREAGNRRGQSATLDSLGCAHHHLGHYAKAIACFRQTLATLGEVGDHFLTAEVLTHLGDSQLADGNPGAARDSWQDALDLLKDAGHGGIEEVRDRLHRLAGRRPGSSTGRQP